MSKQQNNKFLKYLLAFLLPLVLVGTAKAQLNLRWQDAFSFESILKYQEYINSSKTHFQLDDSQLKAFLKEGRFLVVDLRDIRHAILEILVGLKISSLLVSGNPADGILTVNLLAPLELATEGDTPIVINEKLSIKKFKSENSDRIEVSMEGASYGGIQIKTFYWDVENGANLVTENGVEIPFPTSFYETYIDPHQEEFETFYERQKAGDPDQVRQAEGVFHTLFELKKGKDDNLIHLTFESREIFGGRFFGKILELLETGDETKSSAHKIRNIFIRRQGIEVELEKPIQIKTEKGYVLIGKRKTLEDGISLSQYFYFSFGPDKLDSGKIYITGLYATNKEPSKLISYKPIESVVLDKNRLRLSLRTSPLLAVKLFINLDKSLVDLNR